MKAKRTLITGVLLVSMAFMVTSCTKVKHYDTEDFIKIMDEEFSVDEEDLLAIGSYGIDEGYYFDYEDAEGFFFKYDSEKEADKAFDEILDNFEGLKTDEQFNGSDVFVNLSGRGYLVIDGDIGEDYFYGGYYWSEDMIFGVSTAEDNDDARKEVDEVLDAFGYKKP